MTEGIDLDAVHRAQAAVDQLDALMRDLYLPAAVRIERRIRSLGGSRRLAARVAGDYVDGLLRVSGFGRRNEET